MGFSIPRIGRMTMLAAVLVAAGFMSSPAAAADMIGIAYVRSDGSLYLNGRTVYLYGIYIPPTERDCAIGLRPVRCGSRSVLALDRYVDGFVQCRPVGFYANGSLSAVCYVRHSRLSPGRDLAAKMIANGWALAGPGAPFEYTALERIAIVQERGIWRDSDQIARYFYE